MVSQKFSDSKSELEYLLKNDFLNEVTQLSVYAQLKKTPLPKPKKVYERYPQFKDLSGNGYISAINSYIEKISEEVDKINNKTSGASILVVGNLIDGLKHYIKEYPNKK